jgi:signal transduction histidine kinase
MFLFIRKMSLQTRLFALTAFALLALLIAVLSAYRTARTSEFYAERQASASVNSAVRELERETTETENFGKNRRIPPHVREASEKYQDIWTRRTAIAFHGNEEVSGGFCVSNGETKGAIFNQNFSTDEMQFVQNACRQLGENDTRRYDFANSTLFVASAKFDEGNDENVGAFAVRRVAKSRLFADRFSFFTQAFLLFSVIGLVIFSFLTLRDWRGGMLQIERGLRAMPQDLSSRIDAPPLAELNQISLEINRLAENLETNLTRQKSLEKDLAHSEKLAALGRMASGAAHEIRNPLAAMKLKIQLAERNKFDTEKLEKTFAVLGEEIERLDNIVKKLLDASRPAKLDFSKIKINNLLETRLSMIAEKAESQRVEIKLETNDEAVEIEADREKLTQVFDNLFNNALEAMTEGGVLRVKTLAENGKFIAKVSDTGKGISDAEKSKLFELFYTTKDKGTGLGLAISREITEAHSGRLYFSELETGAVFVVELPLAK